MLLALNIGNTNVTFGDMIPSDSACLLPAFIPIVP